MGLFSRNNATAFVGGAHGFFIMYDDVHVSYRQPNEYKEGEPLVGFLDQEPPFKDRISEIIAWGAICIAAGETLLRTFDALSFAPGLDASLKAFRKDAIGLVCWRLRLERIEIPADDMGAAIEKELEHIKVCMLTPEMPKDTFIFKSFGGCEK